MPSQLWWIIATVLLGALISAGLLSQVYVREQVPPAEIERLAPSQR